MTGVPTIFVHYVTVPGERIVVERPDASDVDASWSGRGWWRADLDTGDDGYRYAVVDERTGGRHREAGGWRHLTALAPSTAVIDHWKAPEPRDRALSSGAFGRVLRRRVPVPLRHGVDEPTHRFCLFAPDLDPDRDVILVGDHPALGSWDPARGLPMGCEELPWWSVEVDLGHDPGAVEYKYVVTGGLDGATNWERDDNRILPGALTGPRSSTVIVDQQLRIDGRRWRGSGVAVPLASIRVADGAGVGRFSDLAHFSDWAAAAGQHLVQLLPVNDTTLTHDTGDSYPYSPISSVALHPLHVDSSRIGEIADPDLARRARAERRRLEALDHLDHAGVMRVVWTELGALYRQACATLDDDGDFATFCAAESAWLDAYAAFCVLRDRHGPDRADWGPAGASVDSALAALEVADTTTADELRFHRWVQWHLHRQLDEAVDHARSIGVILKGDLPIGVSPHSVDVWESPELFDTGASAGAPPDDFSAEGQNWGFPTYRWDRMAADGYLWWRRRLRSMARAFDAYRIDHVLGFFRIWQVPTDQVHGMLGHFDPCLPLDETEITARLGWFDRARLCEPWLPTRTVEALLGEDHDALMARLGELGPDGRWRLQPSLRTQRAIAAELGPDHPQLAAALRLPGEVLSIEVRREDGTVGHHPRVDPTRTRSLAALPRIDRVAWTAVYDDFYQRRHDALWEGRGRTTLPALLDATDLMVCGEDLGMVPDFVPGVLRELGVLSLEIQRMPKDHDLTVGDPALAPELAVVATGTHDMPTLRSWWEAQPDQAAEVWAQLGHVGPAPATCTAQVASAVVARHLASPALWAILPLQDLLATDADIRHDDPGAEQINDPSDPDHVWSYRMHVSTEDLIDHDVTAHLRRLVGASGRSHPADGPAGTRLVGPAADPRLRRGLEPVGRVGIEPTTEAL